MRVVYVREPELAEKLFRFRYEMYVSHFKWLNSKDYPHGILHDNFDSHSFNYVALDENMVVGSVRITLDGPKGLPLDICNPLDGFRKDRAIAELGRLVVDHRYDKNLLGALLMKAGYQCAVQYGANYIVIDIFLESQDFYLKMGFIQIGDKYDDPNFNFNVPSVTMALDCITAQKEWPYTHPRLYRYFTTPDNRIEHPE